MRVPIYQIRKEAVSLHLKRLFYFSYSSSLQIANGFCVLSLFAFFHLPDLQNAPDSSSREAQADHQPRPGSVASDPRIRCRFFCCSHGRLHKRGGFFRRQDIAGGGGSECLRPSVFPLGRRRRSGAPFFFTSVYYDDIISRVRRWFPIVSKKEFESNFYVHLCYSVKIPFRLTL